MCDYKFLLFNYFLFGPAGENFHRISSIIIDLERITIKQ